MVVKRVAKLKEEIAIKDNTHELKYSSHIGDLMKQLIQHFIIPMLFSDFYVGLI